MGYLKLTGISLIILLMSFQTVIFSQEEETVYYLGKVKQGSIVEKDFDTKYIPKSIITSCQCLKVELKKEATKADLLHIRLDTSGYKGYNTLYFYLVLTQRKVVKVNLSFEVNPVRKGLSNGVN